MYNFKQFKKLINGKLLIESYSSMSNQQKIIYLCKEISNYSDKIKKFDNFFENLIFIFSGITLDSLKKSFDDNFKISPMSIFNSFVSVDILERTLNIIKNINDPKYTKDEIIDIIQSILDDLDIYDLDSIRLRITNSYILSEQTKFKQLYTLSIPYNPSGYKKISDDKIYKLLKPHLDRIYEFYNLSANVDCLEGTILISFSEEK